MPDGVTNQKEIYLFQAFPDSTDHEGDLFSPEHIEEVIQLHTQRTKRRASIASDMDGTMFKEDLGLGVFFLKMLNPEFWQKISTEQFRSSLLNEDLQKALKSGMDLSPNISVGTDKDPIYITDAKACCQAISDTIIPAILALFEKIKNNGLSPEEKQEALNNFAYANYILDQIIMKLERVFEPILDGKIIPRTRLLAGFTKKNARDLTEQLLQITHDSPQSSLTFSPENIDPNFLNINGATIKPEFLEEVIGTRATRVTAIKRLYQRLVHAQLVYLNIITTNLPEIAQTIAESTNSPYHNTFVEQVAANSGTEIPDYIHGTKLSTANGIYLPNLEHKGVLRDQKLARTMDLDRINKTLVAAGDTTTDWLMIQHTIVTNGGYGILVGPTLEATQQRFAASASNLNPAQKARLLFAEASTYTGT